MIDQYADIVTRYQQVSERFAELADGTYGTEMLAEYGPEAHQQDDVDPEALLGDMDTLLMAWSMADNVRQLEHTAAQAIYENRERLEREQRKRVGKLNQTVEDAEQTYRVAKRRLANTEADLQAEGLSLYDLRASKDPTFQNQRRQCRRQQERARTAEETEHALAEIQDVLAQYDHYLSEGKTGDIEAEIVEEYFTAARKNIHALDDLGLHAAIQQDEHDPAYGEQYRNLSATAALLNSQLPENQQINVPELADDPVPDDARVVPIE